MADISCATCPFGEPFDGGAAITCHCSRSVNLCGECNAPSWWCSEHPLAPGQRDRIAERIVLANIAGIQAARMVYDFGSLLKDAYRNADLALAERAKGSK